MLEVSESITPWFLLFFCRCGVINLHLVLLLKLLFFLFFLFPCSLGLDRLKLSCLPFTKCVISYSIIDLDPCRNINCTYESFCYARDEWTYECRRRSNCPSYEEHVWFQRSNFQEYVWLQTNDLWRTRQLYKLSSWKMQWYKILSFCLLNFAKSTLTFLLTTWILFLLRDWEIWKDNLVLLIELIM